MSYLKKSLVVLLSFVLVLVTVMPTSTQAAVSEKDTAISWAINNKVVTINNATDRTKVVTDQELVTAFSRVDNNYSLNYVADVAYNFYSEFYLPFKGTTSAAGRIASVKRGEFARIYAAFKGLDLSEKQAIQYLYINELSTGVAGKRTYSSFNPTGNLTRADLAVFLHRSSKKGAFAVQGLKRAGNGSDNAKITLPPGFDDSTTSDLENGSGNGNDIVGPEGINNAVQSINVEKTDLIANGQDSSVITLSLKDCFGVPIANDKSYTFQVLSSYGARIVDASNEPVRNIQSDGNMLSAKVVAPALTKSVRDTITFELINNKDANMKCLVGKKIEAEVRYAPKAEMRISYDVYDPDQPDLPGIVDPPVYPPYVKGPQYFTLNKPITVHELFENDKKFHVSQFTTYTNELNQPETGILHYGANSNAKNDAIEYKDAVLKFEDYEISVWLFEEIIKQRLRDSAFETTVDYSQHEDGRPVYQIKGVDDSIASQVEHINSVGSIIKLLTYLPEEKDLTLDHYDSVMKIWAIYENLGNYDRVVFLKHDSGKTLGKLEAYYKRMLALKESAEEAARPEGMARYTKVMVTLVSPGGEIITDYQGTVKIMFNGVEKISSFITNTSDYLNNTGSAGVAVAYFDSIEYGDAVVTAELTTPLDPRYSKILKDVANTSLEKSIYTNPKFEKNSCSLAAEVAYVMDYSTSMNTIDPYNYRGLKTNLMIKQMNADYNIAVKTTTKGYVIKEGDAKTVTAHSLFKNEKESGATNVISGINVALNKFTSDTKTSKSIVLVSDGRSSEAELEKALRTAKKLGVKIYTVGYGEKSQLNEKLLAKLAKDTGGSYFHAATEWQMHSAYQIIIDSILCKKVYDSCLYSPTMFNDATVVVRKGYVTMNARINTNCTNVARVAVRYTSKNGDIQFDLTSNSRSVFSTRKQVALMENFNLSKQVEFLAYDKNGQLLASTKATVKE
ncbi:MAG: VWA domain-containing protein [Lysinibacillus sp.]